MHSALSCLHSKVHGVAKVLLVTNQAPQDESVSTCYVLPLSVTSLKLLKRRHNVGPEVVPSLWQINVLWKRCQQQA